MLAKSNRKRKQRIVADINITPFTDVILVLLVIFMVTTPLMSQSTLKVKLPEAKSAQPMDSGNDTKVYVTVNNEGILYLNNKIVTRKELKEQLAVIQRKNPQVGVVLRADKASRFKDVVEVLDSLNELAIAKLDIETLTSHLR
ncbi:MAG: biopolymer transporter ExbD [Candidatus Omnitrophica bacterium]|nr:biopolymer transporter ExbD [Candidatus Omnitrophota bacterium]